MTDEMRNKLDRDVEDFIDICNSKVNVLNQDIRQDAATDQIMEHRRAVIQIIIRILNNFVNYYAQLRGTRMKRTYEKERYDRIESASGRISPSQEFESISSDTISLENLGTLIDEDKFGSSNVTQSSQNSSHNIDDWHQQSLIAAEHHTSISPEEIQTLALENSQIHDELLTLNDEVKSIGKKVVQISKLQELFTEKVMEQEVELNNLHETAIRSSENVREGNELIRDAMMKNASTRVFILFYIVTLGFTILFLDWYNP